MGSAWPGRYKAWWGKQNLPLRCRAGPPKADVEVHLLSRPNADNHSLLTLLDFSQYSTVPLISHFSSSLSHILLSLVPRSLCSHAPLVGRPFFFLAPVVIPWLTPLSLSTIFFILCPFFPHHARSPFGAHCSQLECHLRFFRHEDFAVAASRYRKCCRPVFDLYPKPFLFAGTHRQTLPFQVRADRRRSKQRPSMRLSSIPLAVLAS